MDNNKKQEIFKRLLDIKSLLIIDKDDNFSGCQDTFEVYNNVIIEGQANIVKFHRFVDYVWNSNSDLLNNYTRDKILHDLIQLISSSEDPTKGELDIWLTQLNKQKAKEYWIVKAAKGAQLLNQIPVKIGPFLIIDKKVHKGQFYEEEQFFIDNWDKLWIHCPEDILIGIKISVKELNRGYQIADYKFSLFENVVSFLNGGIGKYSKLSIVNFGSEETIHYYALDKGYGLRNSLEHQINFPINLNSEKFSGVDEGSKFLFSIMEKSDLNDIESRIIRSISWLGKGLREVDDSKLFIQLMFAIESLLNYRSGEIIEPSILSKISEFIAFTLGKDYETMVKLEKEFKDLYVIRSALAHGESKVVSQGDVILLLNLTNDLIWEFLNNAELRQCCNFDDYRKWVMKKKYK